MAWETVFQNALRVQITEAVLDLLQNINGDRRVRLFCPHNADEKAYIYRQKNEEYDRKILLQQQP